KSWWYSKAHTGEETSECKNCSANSREGNSKEDSASPTNVELFQFIGKDNIPFHTVIFPCTLLGSETGETSKTEADCVPTGSWTKLF
ncbi:class I tRNA ligase family protein, partial [Streptomyces caniscabiei]|uniref:class I tRNA ligase family protein n=1 Tax=Streptomyces caniscabiei TaxID=2746961 RepID=UPI0038F6F324